MSDLVGNPKDWFSRVAAPMKFLHLVGYDTQETSEVKIG